VKKYPHNICPCCGAWAKGDWTCKLCGVPVCSKDCRDKHADDGDHPQHVAGHTSERMLAALKKLHRDAAKLDKERAALANEITRLTFWLRAGDLLVEHRFVGWKGWLCWREAVTQPLYHLVCRIDSWDRTAVMDGNAAVRTWRVAADGEVLRVHDSGVQLDPLAVMCARFVRAGHIEDWDTVHRIDLEPYQ